jgi:hypothetical protein
MNDFNYYTGREVIPVLRSRAEVEELLRQPQDGYILDQRSRFEKLESICTRKNRRYGCRRQHDLESAPVQSERRELAIPSFGICRKCSQAYPFGATFIVTGGSNLICMPAETLYRTREDPVDSRRSFGIAVRPKYSVVAYGESASESPQEEKHL